MIIASIPQLVAFFTNIFLFFIVLQYRQKQIHVIYCVFSMCVSIWTICAFALFYNLSIQSALIWGKALHVAVLLIPALFFHFVTLLLKSKRAAFFVLPIYTLSGIFFVLNVLGFLIVSVNRNYFGYYSQGSRIYPLFSLYVVSVITTSLILILKEIFKKNIALVEKKQLLTIAVGTGLALIGGINDLLPVIGFQTYPFTNFPVYRLGSLMIGIYGICVAYSIIRYQLMDIDVIIRRAVVFAGLLTFVFGIFSAATFLVQEVLSKLGAGKVWTYGISLFFIVLGYDHIRNLLVNLTDKYFFQKKYDYQKLLKDAARGMSKIESLHKLLGLVTHVITMRMRVKNAAIMMKRRDNEYELGYQRGYEKNFLEYRLDDTNPMIMYLKREKESVEIEHVREFMESGNKKVVKGEKPHEYDFQAILLTMQELSAACVIPSFLGHELQNILLIGEKKSGDYYTTDDLNVLFTLAQESAIAIENAKLFDEAVRRSSQLEKINEQLEYSRNLLMKALRETEVANKQLQDTQAQLIHEQKMATLGRLAASVGHEVNNPLTILSMNVSRAILKYRKNPDLRVGEVLELFQKMEQNIGRIKAVVNTLTGLLKRSEKGKFEPLSLKLILEETLPLVQFQTYLDNLTGTEVDFDISGSVPLIRGDLERLQEVFLNLFINAYHAMMGKRNRRIRVTAEMDTENAHNVAVHFTDNGCGMTEEVMKKIFNYGFTTKPPGRGSGMGLYMCKYIIELHGGDIRVRSKVGEGTTFTITLPAYEEGLGEGGGSMRIEATS